MPFLTSRFTINRALLVLAFGPVSFLEVCSLFAGQMAEVDLICERVATVRFEDPETKQINCLGGIHKLASPTIRLVSANDYASLGAYLEKISDSYGDIRNLSVSPYCGAESSDAHEELVASILASLRSLGFRKTNLLRPRGGELSAEEVMSREALDFVLVPSRDGHLLGPTIFVPDYDAFRRRGTAKPVTRSDISMSARLARTLVNLAGLSKGESLLDPFCGSGTILSEAALLSLNCLGVDSNPKRVLQAKQNLAWLEAQSGRHLSYQIEVGDARDLESLLERKVDGIASEPILLPRFESTPSSQTARKLVKTAGHVYSDALHSMANVVKKGGRIVLVVPIIKTGDGSEVSLRLEDVSRLGLKEFQPSHGAFDYPVRVGFESTRWVRRAVYVFERL